MSKPNHRAESRLFLCLDDLQTAVRQGERFSYVLFRGHRSRRGSAIGPECLSQWYHAEFVVDDVPYPTAEHFIMAEKARLFGDAESERAILSATSPAAAKRLGRQVRGFKEDLWLRQRFGIAVRGNRAKFGQNGGPKRFLRSTGSKILAEASPHDRIWGIGLGPGDPGAKHPRKWKGLNLLGFVLMQVRHDL